MALWMLADTGSSPAVVLELRPRAKTVTATTQRQFLADWGEAVNMHGGFGRWAGR